MSPGTEPETAVRPSPTSPVPLLQVLWLGDRDRPEFRASWDFLEQSTRLFSARTIEQAISLDTTESSIDLVIIAQALPGEFSLEQVDSLRRAYPLVPLVGLLGSWCEGEARSGQAWPGVPRVYWHQFPARMREELARWSAGRSPQWAEPATVSEEERFLAASDEPLQPGQGLIVIDSPYFDGSQFLAEACRRQGYQTVEITDGPVLARVRGVRAAVWDCDRFDGQANRLRALVTTVRPAPVIALLSFPRIDQAQDALAAGAAEVLSKPLRLSEFFSLLSRLA